MQLISTYFKYQIIDQIMYTFYMINSRTLKMQKLFCFTAFETEYKLNIIHYTCKHV